MARFLLWSSTASASTTPSPSHSVVSSPPTSLRSSYTASTSTSTTLPDNATPPASGRANHHLRVEIYNQLQKLDEQQERIEQHLARFPPAAPRTTRPLPGGGDDEDGYEFLPSALVANPIDEPEDEQGAVLVEDVNRDKRRKSHLAALAAVWREREQVRRRARDLGVQIDGWGRGEEDLMEFEAADTRGLAAPSSADHFNSVALQEGD
ncbi:hypothetical protein ACQY0O_005045 [Thecaphora frezii]